MTQVLRSSNVPQSWMLIQGILSAGLTMLISARANFSKLEWALLLVEVPSWSRKCSICLAIMSERWNEDLLYKLESHFEILSDDTFKIISAGLAAGRANDNNNQEVLSMSATTHAQIPGQGEQVSESMETNTLNQFNTAAPDALRNEFTADWESMGVFGEFLGVDFMDAYWDLYNTDAEFTASYSGGSTSNAAGQNESLFSA
ncbi:hypothetical protein NW762_010108 [Fusarium torreyae]|uniref:Uncharacterized protein n=1 Tax=Fusarium torreyae TaxID=1237075 RepID=A0A9W8RU90_9HYPO|nr:hypothetical protein NW762_010108 [Fusarium torreyae]